MGGKWELAVYDREAGGEGGGMDGRWGRGMIMLR